MDIQTLGVALGLVDGLSDSAISKSNEAIEIAEAIKENAPSVSLSADGHGLVFEDWEE